MRDDASRPAPRPRPTGSTCSSASTMRRSCRCMRTASARCRCSEKTLIWHLYQAALAGRDIYYDQRYAHTLEMRDVLEAIVTHPAGVDPDDARRDPALHQAVLDQHRPVQQPDRAQVRAATARPRRSPAAAHAAAAGRRARSRSRHGETLDAAARAAAADVLRSRTSIRSSPARRRRAGKDILTASANNLYVGVTMKDLEGFKERYALNSRLVKTGRQARRRGLPRRRPLRHADRGDRRAPRGGDPVCHRADGEGAARADQVLPDRRDEADREAYDIAWVQDKASPVDTINGFIEVYLDARGIKGALGSAGLLRQPARRRREIQKHRRQRAVVRGPHAVGPEVPQARRAGHHRQRHRRRRSRPATRAR